MKIPDIIFSAGLDRALAWTMLHSIWQVTLIALLAGLLLLIMRAHSAQLRYGILNLALLAVLLTSAGTFSYYVCSPRTGSPVVTGHQASGSATDPVIAPAGKSATLLAPARAAQVAVVQNDLRKQLRQQVVEHRPLIVGAWFLGLTIFLCRLLAGITRVYFLRHRMNHPADPYWEGVLQKLALQSRCKTGVALLESALVRSPLTIGHLKPLILFPIGLINRLSESEVEAILAHELAHILRRDYIFNILQSVVEAIFYFHPAVWWLSARVRQERESACDDQAVALLGNKLDYVKALVTVQEMACSSLHPALAFAGSKRSQLLLRVQRLFAPTTTKFNVMEKWIATSLVLCSLLALAFGQRINPRAFQTQRAQIKTYQSPAPLQDQAAATAPFAHNSGLWEATFNGDSVCMTFSSKSKDDHWVNGECFAKKSFTNLNTAPGETAFQLIRPAGNLAMTGKIEGSSGYGRFAFTPDESYRATLAREGIPAADDELLVQCFFANFPANYVSFLQKTGYTNVSGDELMELAIFRLDEMAVRGYLDLAAALGNKKVSLQDLIELKVANVRPDLVDQLAKAGYNDLDMSEVSQFSLHHVDPAFIESMNNLGFGKLGVDDIISAKIHGVDAPYVQQWQNANLGRLSFDDILSAKIHGLDADFVQQSQNMGFGKLSFEDVMSIKIHGMDTDFVRQNKDLSFEEVTSAKIHGIDADFIRQSQALGFGPLSFEEVMSVKIHGITPAYVQQCQGMELGKLRLEDIMGMKIHGIDAAFVRKAQQMDLGTLTVDDLLSLRIHDITPELARTFRDMGFVKLNVEDLLSAKIHDVTPEFIKEAAQKGYRFPTLREYADYKVSTQYRTRRAE